VTNQATQRRLAVLDLRIRLERLAMAAFVETCRPGTVGRHTHIAARLLFLVGLIDAAEQDRVHRLARLGGHVYRQTSDVLHGRVSSLDLGDVVVDEWRTVVTDLEQVMTEPPLSMPPWPATSST
jgi:hypothetical protein